MLRTCTIVSFLLSILLARGVLGQSSVDDDVARVLEETRVDAEYLATDFDAIINNMREGYALNIHVSWKLLESEGIRRDKRLEIRLKDVSLATLLTNVLREADPAGLVGLDYQIADGVILVSTYEVLAQNPILRSYDITDFFESGYADRRFFSTPSLALALTGQETVGGEDTRVAGAGMGGGGYGRGGFGGGGGLGGGGGGNLYNEGGAAPARISNMERIDELIDLLTSTVTPEDWEDNGGLAASVRYYRNALYISHTVNGHKAVKAFFDMLRSNHPRPIDATALIVRVRSDRVTEWRELIGDSFPRMSADRFNEVMRAVPSENIIFRAATAGTNGQRLWFSALTQRDLLVGATPVVGKNTSAYEPQSGFVTEGLELIALPLLAPDGKSIELDVNLAWIPPVSVIERAVQFGPEGGDATIDQLTRSMRTVSTATRLALGEAVTMSIPYEVDPNGLAREWEEWLIIQVRAAHVE